MAWSVGKTACVRTGKGAEHALDVPSTVGALAFLPKGFRLAIAHYGGATLWFPSAKAEPERCVGIAAEAPHRVDLRLLATAINGYQRLYLGDFPRALSELDWTSRLSDVDPPEVFPHDPVIVAAAIAMYLGVKREDLVKPQKKEEQQVVP